MSCLWFKSLATALPRDDVIAAIFIMTILENTESKGFSHGLKSLLLHSHNEIAEVLKDLLIRREYCVTGWFAVIEAWII